MDVSYVYELCKERKLKKIIDVQDLGQEMLLTQYLNSDCFFSF